MRGEKLKGHLELLLLAALDAGPAHGYAIAETLRQRSKGMFDLPDGTIYPALRRLEKTGLAASRWSDDTARRRRMYRLTPAGRRALAMEHHDWSEFARAVMNVVKGVACISCLHQSPTSSLDSTACCVASALPTAVW